MTGDTLSAIEVIRNATKALRAPKEKAYFSAVGFDAEWKINQDGTARALLLWFLYDGGKVRPLVIHPDDLREMVKDIPGRFEEIVTRADENGYTGKSE